MDFFASNCKQSRNLASVFELTIESIAAALTDQDIDKSHLFFDDLHMLVGEFFSPENEAVLKKLQERPKTQLTWLIFDYSQHSNLASNDVFSYADVTKNIKSLEAVGYSRYRLTTTLRNSMEIWDIFTTLLKGRTLRASG